jgi:hypothetical protein
MALFDLIAGLTGQDDPQKKIAAALAMQNNPNPMTQAAWGRANGQPDASAGNPQSQPVAPPDAVQQQMAKQPQAYQSPPDMVALYTQLADRSKNEEGFNRGLGLLAGAFAKPADRAGMLTAMENQVPDASSLVGNSEKLSNDALTASKRQTDLANLPNIAKQLGVPMEQVTTMYNNGTLDNLLQQYNTPDPIMKEYNDYVKEQTASGLPHVNIAEFRQKYSSAARYSNSPIPAYDDKGNLVMYQTNSLGDGRMIQPPPGTHFATPMMDIVLANGQHEIVPKNQPIPPGGRYFSEAPPGAQPTPGTQPAPGASAPQVGGPPGASLVGGTHADNEGDVSKAQQLAADQVKSSQALNDTESTLRSGINTINKFLDDNPKTNPDYARMSNGLAGRTGQYYTSMPAPDTFLGGLMNSDDAKKAQAQLAQLAGTTFKQAYSTLRGGGSITPPEEEAAMAAINQLSHQEMSTDDFKQALSEARDALKRTIESAYLRSGKQPPADVLGSLDKLNAIPVDKAGAGPSTSPLSDPSLAERMKKYRK